MRFIHFNFQLVLLSSLSLLSFALIVVFLLLLIGRTSTLSMFSRLSAVALLTLCFDSSIYVYLLLC